MMAAISASRLSRDVILLEKNPSLGRKLLLSGKGRCNLTNDCGIDAFLERFSGNAEFLRDAFREFFNKDLVMFFQERGLRLVTERQGRVFPFTGRSGGVLAVLERELKDCGVEVFLKTPFKGAIVRDGRVQGVELLGARGFACERLVLATGGVSYAFTGSTGDGIAAAKRLGHTIVPLRPGLVPLVTRERYPSALEGLTLKNIRVAFGNGKRKIVSAIGELMFTSDGISGPLVLSLSGIVAEWLAAGSSVWAEINLKPALSAEQLDARLLREFGANSRKTVGNVLRNLLPRRMAGVCMELAGIPSARKASHVRQGERRRIVSLLSGLRLGIKGTAPLDDAMVTRGGVSLKEINPRTMESRLVKGLYFAGEIMDIDADTGGFNLQAAFSTGFLAGKSAAAS